MDQFTQTLRHTRSLRKYYIAIALFGVLTALLNQATPFVIRSLIDKVSMSDGSGEGFTFEVGMLVAAALALRLGITVIDNINGYVGDMMAVRLRKLLSDRYYERLMQMPLRYFDDELSGTIIGRLERSIETISTFFKQVSNLFLQILLTALMSLAIVAYYAWEVAAVVLLLFPIYSYFTKLSSKLWLVTQEKILELQNGANGRFGEVVAQMRVVRSFTSERAERKRFSKSFTEMIGLTKNQSRKWHYLDVARRSTMDILLSLTIAFIIYRGFQGSLSLGEIFLLFSLSEQMVRPLTFISFLVDNYQRMVSASKDYFEIMDFDLTSSNESNVNLRDRNSFESGAGDISFKNLSFSYNKGEKVLSKITFDVPAGSHVALVGESGGGKSTITGLMQGFYSPTSGTIKIDSQDIQKVNRRELLGSIGVVFQEPVLFSGSIAENIRYGAPDATDAEVKKAAKAANAHDFIMKLKKGYASEIGERGVKLSGGQKQRISIARAILKDPQILILDEATSSLDSKSEQLVQNALNALMKGRTTLMIAHRLSTIAAVDTIVTLKDGRVDEIGSPAALAKTKGVYASLLKLQNLDEEELKKQLAEYDLVG